MKLKERKKALFFLISILLGFVDIFPNETNSFFSFSMYKWERLDCCPYYTFLCWMLLSSHWHSSLWGEKIQLTKFLFDFLVLIKGYFLLILFSRAFSLFFPFFKNVIHSRGLELGDFKGPFQPKTFYDSIKEIMPHFKAVLQSFFMKIGTLLLLSILLGPCHLHLSPEMTSHCSEIAVA